jgi:glycosyltransferase involved in cell wall biosynthesis
MVESNLKLNFTSEHSSQNNENFLVALIPALDEEDTIAWVVEKTLKYVDLVVVVDDCSTDATAINALRAGARVISTSKRRRIGGVIKTGLFYIKKLNPDVIIILDGDAQHDPDNIPGFLKILKDNGVDWIIGSRFKYNILKNQGYLGGWYFRQKKHMHIKGIGNWFFSKLVSTITNTYFTDVMSGFKALNQKAIHNLDLKFDYAYCPEMAINLCSNGLKMMEYPIEAKRRHKGSSKVITNILEYGVKQLGIVLFTSIRNINKVCKLR